MVKACHILEQKISPPSTNTPWGIFTATPLVWALKKGSLCRHYVLNHLLPRAIFSLERHMQLLLILGCSIYNFEQRVKGGQGFTFWTVLFNVSGNRWGIVTSVTVEWMGIDHWWNDATTGILRHPERTQSSPNDNFSTNPTWIVLGWNPSLCWYRSASTCQSHCTVS